MKRTSSRINSEKEIAIKKYFLNKTEYWVKGKNPTLLIVSGMHGDEYQIIDLISRYISKNFQTMPDFLYIPFFSPSAVAKRKRVNRCGNDLNRSFKKRIVDKEAQTIEKIISSRKFSLFIEWHEDLERAKEFYYYDNKKLSGKKKSQLKKLITASGAISYNGLDDVNDPDLGLKATGGYIKWPRKSPMAGFFCDWVVTQGFVKQAVNPEVPGIASLKLKKKLIEKLFPFFIN